jgi:23S rRNA (guanosine2251-2'-O)-methyltransferase
MTGGKGATELVVYGRRAVLEALAAPDVEVMSVRLARGTAKAFRHELSTACRSAGVAIETSRLEAVRELSGEPRHDQGVAARVRLFNVMEVEAFTELLKGERARHRARVLALDGVTNPQNIGMIVRSALAARMDGLLWPLSGSPWISGLIVKASAGAIFRCPVIRCSTLAEGLYCLKAAGFEIEGLAPDSPESLFDFDAPHRSAFVVGSELLGISDEIGALIDHWLRIPIHDEVESLNVAVAAALVCFRVAGA